MSYVVVASVPIDANRETLDRAAGRPLLHEVKYTDSEEASVRGWNFDDRAQAEQAVARLNKIPGVSAKIRDDSDEPRR